MSKTYSLDNSGNLIAPHPNAINPKAGSGITITTNGSQNTNDTDTVVSGATYAMTNIDGTDSVLLGLATTATAANVIWVIAPGQTVIVKIPEGTTTIHHQSIGTSVVVRAREVMPAETIT